MSPKNSKKNKKSKSNSYKKAAIFGGVFHFLVYLFLDKTIYPSNLLYGSILFCGVITGIYAIYKLELYKPTNYRKLKGVKLKAYMILAGIIIILGSTLILGNVINGTVLGINYLTKDSDVQTDRFEVIKITHNKSKGTKGRRKFRVFRNNPKVYIQKDGKVLGINLSESYNSDVDYTEFKTIELDLKKGGLGFEVIDNYYLKK